MVLLLFGALVVPTCAWIVRLASVGGFAEWAAYPPAQQRDLLSKSCRDASTGKMPGAWTLLHPEAKLSTQDVQTICGAARQAVGYLCAGW